MSTSFRVLSDILNEVNACLKEQGVTTAFSGVVFCGPDHDCPSWLTVAGGELYASTDDGLGQNAQRRCASFIVLPVVVELASVCIPQPQSNGKMPDASAKQCAAKAAIQQSENLLACLLGVDFGPCSLSTLPSVSCDVKGTTYVSTARFSVALNCLEKVPQCSPCC